MFNYSIDTELYEAGTSCDGSAYTAEAYYVGISNKFLFFSQSLVFFPFSNVPRILTIDIRDVHEHLEGSQTSMS